LRHRFRARDSADCRLMGSYEWRPVTIKRLDSRDGSYSVLFDDDTVESGGWLDVCMSLSLPLCMHD